MKVELENWQVKALSNYFGINDKTSLEHWAYEVFNKAYKEQLTLTDVSQQSELLAFVEWYIKKPELIGWDFSVIMNLYKNDKKANCG